jgi:hypothetical protein
MSEFLGAPAEGVSRRILITGASVAFACPSPGRSKVDQALEACRRWCVIEQDSRSLVLTWQRLETWLFRHRNWPNLTAEEQAAVPEAAALTEIDARLDVLAGERDSLLPQIRSTPASSREGLLLKFEVAIQLIADDEQPEARGLLRSVRDDLLRLWT